MPFHPATARARRADEARARCVLTARDLLILNLIALYYAIPVDLLAEQFDVDPVTGRVNTNPLRACERRLQVLASAGYVWLTSFHDGDVDRPVAMLGPSSVPFTGVAPARTRIPPKKRAHHVRTLEALGALNAHARGIGARVVESKLEHKIRQEQQLGRYTKRGERLALCPDAACTVEVDEPLGKTRRLKVAVEYVTSKYSDKDIADKRDAFGSGYDRVVWFADRASTAARVQRITGAPCTTLTPK